MTDQRQVILDVVKKADAHLSADEIYEKVRRKIPKISMGTVYRNLDILSSCGFIRKLEPDYPQMRFDGNTEDHYHVLCIRCGSIEDIAVPQSQGTLETLKNALGRMTRYGIFGHKLEFVGLCPDCMEKEGPLEAREDKDIQD